MKKIIPILALLLVFSMVIPATAVTPTRLGEDLAVFEVNELYADSVSSYAPVALVDDLFDETPSHYASTLEEYAKDLREQLVNRSTRIVLGFSTTQPLDKSFYSTTLDLAFAHTGNPKEGDYLRFTWQSYKASGSGYIIGGTYYYTLTYNFNYYTTAEQETQVDAAINALLPALTNSPDDYDRVCAIYDFICNSVTYDNEHLNDDSYYVKWAAYGALIDKTAVCQGYANLFYRLALECGIDSRIVSGYGNGERHAWNIVQLDGYYYNLDATWDAARVQSNTRYSYFLKSDIFFLNHTPDAEYLTNEFKSTYQKALWNYNKQDASHRHEYSNAYTTITYATAEADGIKAKLCACGQMSDISYVPYVNVTQVFSDIKVASWSKNGLSFVVSNGIMSGTSATTFSQKDTMTRAMFVSVLWRLAGSPEPETTPTFRDLEKKQTWYHKAVAWASENGIVYGTDAYHFNPTGNVTREQIATFLYRYATNIKGDDTSGRANLLAFPDGAKVSSFAKDALAWATDAGILHGKSISGKVYLKPQDNATREEVAVLITAFCTK